MVYLNRTDSDIRMQRVTKRLLVNAAIAVHSRFAVDMITAKKRRKAYSKKRSRTKYIDHHVGAEAV